MEWIDSHCHLEKAVQKRELDAVLERSRAAGVHGLITIGTEHDDWPLYAKLAREYTGRIYWTAGLHPGCVEEDYRDQLALLSPCWTESVPPVALGEIGLDYFRLPKDPEEAGRIKRWQADAFRYQLDLAMQFDMPVVVHSRAAFDDCVALIDGHGFDWSRVVFHCFAEGPEEMQRLKSRGGRASFTGIITFKNGHAVRSAMLEQGIGKLMVETDAPYLAPEPHRGQPCEPAMVALTGARCAELLGLDTGEVAHTTTRNAELFFGL